MQKSKYKWEWLTKVDSINKTKINLDFILDTLLNNRGINTKQKKREFFDPPHPTEIDIKDLSIDKLTIDITIDRIRTAISKKEKIIIYGDYDADGVCATAILWECLYSYTKNVTPYIPDRFAEGYGINSLSVQKLKKVNPDLGLIITVDNGIVAKNAIDKAKSLGIDVVVTDHHQKEKVLPEAYSIIHTDKICGSAVAWVLTREINRSIKTGGKINNLELAAIGTIADQLPLVGANRSFAKYGLEALKDTKRPGLIALMEETSIHPLNIGTYEVNYLIAPRINAMGRLEHAIDSLRLLCTNNLKRARELSLHVGMVNQKRQKIVDEVVSHAQSILEKKKISEAIVMADESYHEGVIGLAASRLVEEFYRPAIVISKGKEVSKASARSVAGFNIIENIRKLDSLIVGGGGHPMAAGFSIKTDSIEVFTTEFQKLASKLLSDELLTKKIKVDLEIGFDQINMELLEKLSSFEPCGVGNPKPLFATSQVEVAEAKAVGSDSKHLSLVLKQGNIKIKTIAFGKGEFLQTLNPEDKIDIAYNIDKDTWNGRTGIQLKIKDLKIKK